MELYKELEAEWAKCEANLLRAQAELKSFESDVLAL